MSSSARDRSSPSASWDSRPDCPDNSAAQAPRINGAGTVADDSGSLKNGSDGPSLRRIFDEHAGYVWRSLRHLGVAEADIEDVCQEVFITVHRKLGEFEGRSTLRTWLYGICLRVASDYRRRAYVRRERAVAEPRDDSASSSTNQPDLRAEARGTLLHLLDLLDDDKRAVLVLYEIEGLSMKEVAEVIGCPLQTAYSRLHAARKVVSEAYAELESGTRLIRAEES
jgi:RNA polymerase sigma-70 factor (ECF subfamily)